MDKFGKVHYFLGHLETKNCAFEECKIQLNEENSCKLKGIDGTGNFFIVEACKDCAEKINRPLNVSSSFKIEGER